MSNSTFIEEDHSKSYWQERYEELREKYNQLLKSKDVPKVDLEEEITRWLENGDITDTRFNDYDDSDIERTARHFFELGLNARKEVQP